MPALTIPDLLSNEDLRRQEFPVTRDKIFLAHAGVCPLPERVVAAVRQYASECAKGDQETLLPLFQLQQTRALAARLIGAKPEEIAFVGPTSLALSYVAAGLQLKKNDNILVYQDDYPSNVYPWMALAERGVQVRFLNIREFGRIRAMDVMGHVDENTRFVALASCHFVAGWRIDLDEIGAFLRQHNILFCVDAIQTLGAFPTPIGHVDFLAADAHKWMLGPCAAGILYVRQPLQDELTPMVYGWNNVRCPNFVAEDELVFRPDARRYEAGTHNLFGMVGLHAALELLLEIGVENIAAELLRKRSWLVPALQNKGYTVLQPQAPPQNASAIVSFYRSGTDLAALHTRLESHQIITSLRADRSGRQYLRLSPHFYNTDTELHQLLGLL